LWRLVKSESAATNAIRLAKSKSAARSVKSSRPESRRSRISVRGRRLSRGANPSRVFHLSAHQGFVLSFPLFRLSRSEVPPAKSNFRVRRKTPAAAQRRLMGASLIARFACPRGCSSAGRAPALQAGGQRFEPAHLHQHIDNRIGLSRSPECRKQFQFSGSSSCK
jgi:hypothetical protein